MKIRFKCNLCGSTFEKNDEEIMSAKQSFTYCYCGGRLEIDLNSLISEDIDTQVERTLETYLNTLGIEGTIEMLERNKNYGLTHLYITKLHEKGLM